MKLILHKIELNARDVEASRKFYHDFLGLSLAVDQSGLKVFDTGLPGLDFDISTHNPGQTKISFLTDDLEELAARLEEKNCRISDFYETHLGLRAFELTDPDNNKIEIQTSTEQSPQYLQDMFKS